MSVKNTKTAHSVECDLDVAQEIKQGWCSKSTLSRSNASRFFGCHPNELEKTLRTISPEHFEYVYPVVYGNGTELLKTPMQLVLETENFDVAEILLEKGVSLPDYISEDHFETHESKDYFSYLSRCSYDLFIEYHQLKAEEKCSVSGKSNTQSNKLTSTELLRTMQQKYANSLSEATKAWVDNKVSALTEENHISIGMRQ